MKCVRVVLIGFAIGVGAWVPQGLTQADPPADVRPWSGVLPDPDQADHEESRWLSVRVLDQRTRTPIVGARWVRTPEWIAPHRLHHDVVMEVARTGPDGIAFMPTRSRAWKHDCHWLVLAEGYAPSYEYATRPEPEVLLERGVVVSGRVLDPFGRGVSGALVEYLGGCSHGTAAARAVADDGGRFTLGPVPSSLPGQLWVAGRRIAADLLALDRPASAGRDCVQLAMDLGLAYRGTVVDPLERPLAGVVVRAWNEQRGPTAMTDANGRFALDSVEPGAGIVVFGPGALLDEVPCDVDDTFPATPTRIVLSGLGVMEREATGRVRFRARMADGAPATGVSFRLVGEKTGRGPSGMTAERDEPDGSKAGEAVEEAVPGSYRVEPDDPFSPVTFDPISVVVRAGAEVVAEARMRAQPRLAIRGAIPASADLQLTVPGASTSAVVGEDAWPEHLPAACEAALRVVPKGRPAFFFSVGVVRDGIRTATVSLPPPRRIRLPGDAQDVELLDGQREAFGYRDGAFFATDAVGRLTLRWQDKTRRGYEAPVELPDTVGGVVQIDTALVRSLPEDDGDSDEGERSTRTGPCALRLRIFEAGEPADALVLVGGKIHTAPAGMLDLRGFDPGRVRVVVAPRDRAEGGLELYLVLKPDRRVTRDLELSGE